ncbi:MAG: hypothetical protein QOD72_1521 [Acidimicrobiaceae bacterium]|jgi:hypothetical protein|nr:hypothetical protein [Acidimicrobiaceae bacterium]
MTPVPNAVCGQSERRVLNLLKEAFADADEFHEDVNQNEMVQRT